MGFDAIYINVPAQDVPVTALLWSARVWLYVCVRVKPSVDELMPQARSTEGKEAGIRDAGEGYVNPLPGNVSFR